MPIYRVDSQRSGIVVRARSSIHDTNTTWDTLSGRVEADPATLDSAGATASLVVDMTSYDAGDWLKNRKLKKDLDLARHPIATFDVTALRDVRQKDRRCAGVPALHPRGAAALHRRQLPDRGR